MALNALRPEQQLSLFQLARSVSADYFHAMYEDKTKEFIEAFIPLCKGECTSAKLLEIDDIFQKLSRGSDLKKVLGDRDAGKARVNKLLCQMGYFLIKADEFLKVGNHEAVAMALIGAGNCGRHYNITGLNPVKKDSIAAKLYDVRASFAHIYINEREPILLSDLINQIMKKGGIKERIDLIIFEAKNMGNAIDIDAYYAKRESSSGSPKAYDKDLLRKPTSIVSSAAATASSRNIPSSSPLPPSSTHASSSKITASKKDIDEPKHGDRERYPSSFSLSAVASSSSSHLHGYDDRKGKRDRDSDRSAGFVERDVRHGHERSCSPPPQARSSSSSSGYSQSYRENNRSRDYGSSSQRDGHDKSYSPQSPHRSHQPPLSSSSYSRPRDDRSSSFSVNYPESSRSAREERSSKHDSKRVRGSSESCRDEVPRYVKIDDSDDDSHKHEKRPSPQQLSSVSNVSSSSSTRDKTHSERRSSSSQTGSSSHSDVRHESRLSSLSSRYGLAISKPKDLDSGSVPQQSDSQRISSSDTE